MLLPIPATWRYASPVRSGKALPRSVKVALSTTAILTSVVVLWYMFLTQRTSPKLTRSISTTSQNTWELAVASILGLVAIGLLLHRIWNNKRVNTIRQGIQSFNQTSSESAFAQTIVGAVETSNRYLWSFGTIRASAEVTASFLARVKQHIHGLVAARLQHVIDKIDVTMTARGLATAVAGFVAAARLVPDSQQYHGSVVLNDNIGGPGTLIGVYLPIILVLGSVIFGHFHNTEAAVKEVGVAILANCLYLTFNLQKALATGLDELSFADVLVALLTIDISTTGISLTMSNKEVLASRSYVGLCHMMQVVSLTTMIVTSVMLGRRGNYQNEPCMQQVWWTVLDSCKGVDVALWMYFCLRLVQLEHNRHLAFRMAPEVDRQKKISDHHKTYPAFRNYRSTMLCCYFEEIPVLLVNCFSLLGGLRRFHLEDTSSLWEWGQSATLTTCLFASAHWLYIYAHTHFHWSSWLTRILPNFFQTPTLQCSRPLALVSSCWLYLSKLVFTDMSTAFGHLSEDELAEQMALSTTLGDIHAVEELLSRGASVFRGPFDTSELQTDFAFSSDSFWKHSFAHTDLKRHGDQVKSPLVTAIEGGHLELVQLYLDLGAPLDTLDLGHKSPLCRAIEARQTGVAELLVKRGAHLAHFSFLVPTSPIWPVFVCSALHSAVKVGSLELVRMVLQVIESETGIEPDISAAGELCDTFITSRNREKTYNLFEATPNVDPLDCQGRTALVLAQDRGFHDVVTELLARGADPDIGRDPAIYTNGDTVSKAHTPRRTIETGPGSKLLVSAMRRAAARRIKHKTSDSHQNIGSLGRFDAMVDSTGNNNVRNQIGHAV